MSYQMNFEHPPVSTLTYPTLGKVPPNRKVSFTPLPPTHSCNAPPQQDTDFKSIYERKLTRLLLAGTELRIAISTAMALTNAKPAYGAHPTPNQQTHQGTNTPSINTLHTTKPSEPSHHYYLTVSHQRLTRISHIHPPKRQGNNRRATRPTLGNDPTSYSTSSTAAHNLPNYEQQKLSLLPHPSTRLSNSVLDEKTKRAQQEQAMQAFGSVTIFCDRQRFGRFDDWAAHLESALNLGNFEEARKLRLMRSKLYGAAAEEFDTFKLNKTVRSQEYAAVKVRLFKLFHSTETRSQRSVEFHNMKRKPEENMHRYANRIRKAFHKAYPMDGILDSATTASREQMMMDRFLEGLPSDVQVPLKYKNFASFQTLINRAEHILLAIGESQTRVRIHEAYASTNAPTNQNELTSVLEALNRLSTKVDQNAATHNEELQQSLAEIKRQLPQRPPQVDGRQKDHNSTQPEAFKRATIIYKFHITNGFHTEAHCFNSGTSFVAYIKTLGHRHNFSPTIRNPRPPPPPGNYTNPPATPPGILQSRTEN
ncbi:hypothetical protein OUZ56_012476 [Daphnia magna]|uniref:Retrotransposon gag domain-containing protein n=1 Tax=Daphnia magna TaxID=35525 RepID=A0ABQ9Z379_9CRUS|nr:hypothetical protein OUZ56_012476 [Daphnia magna]